MSSLQKPPHLIPPFLLSASTSFGATSSAAYLFWRAYKRVTGIHRAFKSSLKLPTALDGSQREVRVLA